MPDFDFSTLITDRSAADLELLRDLLSTPMSDWTAEQLAEFNQAISKGAYNYTDLNRVTQCMEYLDETLRAYGYRTGYQRIIVPHTGGGGSVLPEGYTELEYIESTGSQWIDTQVIPGQADFQVKMDVQSTANASAENWFMTMNQATPAGVGAAFLQVGTWSSKFALHLTAITVDGADAASTDRKTVTLNVQGSTASLTVDSVYTVNNASFATGSYRNYPITFFTDLMRGYAFKINVGDALVRDYIPCTNLSGEAGLYDLVNGQFYGNAGTGAFVAGPEITPEPGELLDPYTWYEADVPTESTMEAYLGNVSALRSVLTLPEDTAQVPGNMAGLTPTEANQIEEILTVIGAYLEAMVSVFRRCGAAICGGPGFYCVN